MWLDPFCRNLELANQADHEDDLPENLSEITDLWNSPARTHVSTSMAFMYIPQEFCSHQFFHQVESNSFCHSHRAHLVESLKQSQRTTVT